MQKTKDTECHWGAILTRILFRRICSLKSFGTKVSLETKVGKRGVENILELLFLQAFERSGADSFFVGIIDKRLARRDNL